MKRVLLWLLPVVDVFKIHDILRYYRSIGVAVPLRHAKLGLLERWAGYLSVGLVLGWIIGPLTATLLIVAVFAAVGPLEFLLMKRGVVPWRFFRGRETSTVLKVFLLEGYNAIGYYLLGTGLACFLAQAF